MFHKTLPFFAAALALGLLACAAGCQHEAATTPGVAASRGPVSPGGPSLPPEARSQMEAQQAADAKSRAAIYSQKPKGAVPAPAQASKHE